MKKIVIGAGLAALLAVPVLAQQEKPDRNAPQTRAAVEARVRERFAAIDTNRDGAVTKAEHDAYREKKHGERRAALFARLDKDGNGQISQAEFMARPERGEAGEWGHRGHHRGHGFAGFGRGDRFAAMDANKDGRVTLAEASARPLAMFDRADANKDGTVTPEERRAAFETMHAEWKAKRGN
ncbi:calcium-binding protein [Sphingomonas oleivorans]|uniref:Calcium-binding protein n=1 Tax=Sphingomonas oleivorans TaxID=1735121 RepID=A0A2T5G391_9SPHN|nr:EF-hand domain-containing protein [Sphingomonas oleivorans]PTQ13618.1 calcium-binding protein [Sphingomonas oleivorans]